PFKHLQFMVTRVANDGKVYGTKEKLDRNTALRIMTMGSAYYVLREKVLGSLEEGKYADLVVIDKDFMKVPDDKLAEMQVLMTVVYGKPAYATSEFQKEIGWSGISTQKAVPPEGIDEDKPERE
nr:amidohydrolase family protein [Burkholderiales bacterium]